MPGSLGETNLAFIIAFIVIYDPLTDSYDQKNIGCIGHIALWHLYSSTKKTKYKCPLRRVQP